MRYKIVLVGDGHVGKTSLVKKYVFHKFDDQYQKTLGTNIYKKFVEIHDTGEKFKIGLQIWDVMGQDIFPAVMEGYMNGANGFLIVCDLTSKESLINIKDWIRHASKANPKCSAVLLANKSDLDDHEFGVSTLEPVSKAFNTPFLITSAKTGENVEEAFKTISEMVHFEQHLNHQAAMDIEQKVSERSPIILAEDAIINKFCNAMGGFENAMPIIRQQFDRLKIDFERPTWDELDLLIDRLMTILQMVKSEEEIKKVKADMKREIRKDHCNDPLCRSN